MGDLAAWLLFLGTGLALGTLFFGGLWWTVRRVATSGAPGALFLVSSLLRTGVVLTGFYLVSGSHGSRMVFCLIGFLLARVAVTWWTRLPHRFPRGPAEGVLK